MKSSGVGGAERPKGPPAEAHRKQAGTAEAYRSLQGTSKNPGAQHKTAQPKSSGGISHDGSQ
nr:MAG TPA: hypothetical protein [Caudoviricetes sp.]